MSPRTSPPFRADHVGSFLRPARLHEARQQRADGAISAEQLRAVEDEAVREVVALQREAGLRSVTDGEFRRATWHMDFVYQIGGISKAPGTLLSTFHNEEGDIDLHAGRDPRDARLSMDKTIFGDAFAFLQSVAGDPVPKLTIPAPSMVHYRSGIRAVVDESVYPDVEEFWADLAAAYHDEVQRLAAQGCRYLQLDDTSPGVRERPGAAGVHRRARRGRRAHPRAVHRADQRRGGRPAGGHGDHHAPVPRQLPVLVGGLRRLRLRRRVAVQRA